MADINAIIAQRQAIDARRKPAGDFQTKDKYGRSIWNPKVGGEAAYKAQNGEVDKALERFDQSPLGKLIALHAEGEGSAQTQNQAQIDYHKTGLGQATYAAKEAAPWVGGLPLGAAETYAIRRGVGLGPGSSRSSRAGASIGGLAFSGLEAALAHKADEHSKDSTLTPFQRDVDEGLSNAGYGAAGANAVGSLISPFIGTGTNSNSLAPGGGNGPQGGESGGPVTPPATSPYKGMKPREASAKMLEDLGAQGTSTLRDNLKLLPQAIKGAPEGALRKVAGEWPGVDGAETDVRALRGALESSASKVLSARRTIPVVAPLAFGAAGYGIGDAATSQAQAAGLDDRESNALGNLTRVGGAGIGAGAGYALDRGVGAAGRGINALADAIPENAVGRLASTGLRAIAPAATPIMGGLLLKDALQGTPQIPEDIRGRAWSNPDVQARYFQGLRDEAAQREQVASGFQQNRNNYLAPRAGINPNEAYERPVSVPGGPLPPPGMQGIPRDAAYTSASGYGAPPANALSPNALNPQQQTQAPSPIQRPQSIPADPAEPQEAEAPPRPTPKVPDDYTPGPLQRKQEKMIENALRQKEQERMMQNELALQGPDGNFYRALQAFQQHFAGAGAPAAGAR